MDTHHFAQRRREIAARVRDARLRAGLSQRGLGSRFVPPLAGSTISNWERGLAAVDLPLLEELARQLDQPLSFFIGETGPRHDRELEGLGREVLHAVERRGLLAAPPGAARAIAVAIVDAAGRPGPTTLDVPLWQLGQGVAEPRLAAVPDDELRASGIILGDHAIIDAARVAWDGWAIAALRGAGGPTVRYVRLRDGTVEVRGGDGMVRAEPAAMVLGLMIGLLATGRRVCPADPDTGADD